MATLNLTHSAVTTAAGVRRLIGVTLLLTALFALVACAHTGNGIGAGTAEAGNVEELNTAGEGQLTLVDGAVPIAHLKGRPDDIGFQHGTLLAESIHRYLDGFVLPYIETKGGREVFDLAAELLHEEMSDAERAELEGIAQGARRDAKDILLLNTFLDTAAALAGREGQRYPFAGSIIGADNHQVTAGTPMLGGSMEVALFNEAERPEPVVFVLHPQVGKPFVSVTLPGMIGSLAGQNMDGLAFFAGPVPGPLGLKPTTPFHMVLRRMLARSDSAESAVQYLLREPVTTSHNVLMADASGRVWAVECSSERMAIRKNDLDEELGEHVMLCASHFEDPSMESQQVAPSVESLQRERQMQDRVNTASNGFRTDEFFQTIIDGSIKRDIVASIGFRPASRELFVSVRSDPDAGKPFHKLTPAVTWGLLAPELIGSE